MFAVSKSGHDKNQLYIIIREEKEYVYVSDGIYRTLEKPKKKNKKHIQIIKKEVSREVREKLLLEKKLQNEEVKRAISQYQKNFLQANELRGQCEK